MRSRSSWAVRAALTAGLLFALGGSAAMGSVPRFDSSLPQASDGANDPAVRTPPSSSHHGPTEGHLPATQQELEVVGKLEPTGRFGDVVPGQIADLSVHKGFAYLNSWTEPTCTRGGTYIADIRNPSQPREIGFLPTLPAFYHGEGAHVVSLNTPAFQGDLLAVNNETCQGNSQGVPVTAGGFDLYNVTDPANPVTLIQGAGDRSPEGSLAQNPGQQFANSYHSVFVWQDGPRAFLVGVDNFEESDVDIFDITNPREPQLIADLNLEISFPQIVDVPGGFGTFPSNNHHDVVVKRIGGQMRMKVDYWDAGYVQLEVSNPSNPTYITDTAFPQVDPLLGVDPPEGNAHQGEYSHDNQFILAADEDFTTHRLIEEIGGVEVDPPFGFGVPVFIDNSEPIPELLIDVGEPLAGGTRFIGLGCDPLTIPPPTATATIAVIERGTCTFEAKALNAEDAGYEGFVIFNNSAAGNGCETLINMQFSNPTPVTIKGIFVGREDGLRILGVLDPATYTCTQGGAATPAPTVIPTDGPTLELSALFDGWGYAHLYDANTSQELARFAIPEAVDERFSLGFGDLSIHEFAADPTENLVYSSYYSGGIRVLRFSRANGLEQTGAWIDAQGSNFWGIEQFTTPEGERLIAGSDRDFGLVILRYTGPGAPQRPACSDLTVMVAYRESANVPLNCSDANNNPLRQSRTSNPSGGTVTDRPPAGGWTYRHTGNRIGPAGSFTFRANDGAADSNVATANLVAVAKRGRCVNPFVGTNRRDTIIGSRFGDRIRGRRANDALRGRAGRDCLVGNAGRDQMSGHGHADRLLGNAGRDRVAGNAGRDRLFGNQGNDRLLGGGGRDRLRGGPGRNRYLAGAGADRVFARNDKRDRIRCGKGRDRVVADRNDRVAGDCERVRRG
jgi:PA domain/RTX calcium-binding nonapeptide repeat (4 copies)